MLLDAANPSSAEDRPTTPVRLTLRNIPNASQEKSRNQKSGVPTREGPPKRLGGLKAMPLFGFLRDRSRAPITSTRFPDPPASPHQQIRLLTHYGSGAISLIGGSSQPHGLFSIDPRTSDTIQCHNCIINPATRMYRHQGRGLTGVDLVISDNHRTPASASNNTAVGSAVKTTSRRICEAAPKSMQKGN